jgi:hypothetical protein
MKAQKRSDSIALIFLSLQPQTELVVETTPRPPYFRERDVVSITEETGWGLGSVRTGAVYIFPPGFEPWIIQHVAITRTNWATPAATTEHYRHVKVKGSIYRPKAQGGVEV